MKAAFTINHLPIDRLQLNGSRRTLILFKFGSRSYSRILKCSLMPAIRWTPRIRTEPWNLRWARRTFITLEFCKSACTICIVSNLFESSCDIETVDAANLATRGWGHAAETWNAADKQGSRCDAAQAQGSWSCESRNRASAGDPQGSGRRNGKRFVTLSSSVWPWLCLQTGNCSSWGFVFNGFVFVCKADTKHVYVATSTCDHNFWGAIKVK